MKKPSLLSVLLFVIVLLAATGVVVSITKHSAQQEISTPPLTPAAVEHVSKETVRQTLESLDEVLQLLKKEASEDALLMRFIQEYEQQKFSVDQFESSYLSLQGLKIDILSTPMPQDIITQEDGMAALITTAFITEFVQKNHTLIWEREHTGGRLVTKKNCWFEAKSAFEYSVNPIPQEELQEEMLMYYIEERILPYSATYQVLFSAPHVQVMGGDQPSLRNIGQRVFEYSALIKRGKTPPSDLDPSTYDVVLNEISKTRNLYLLKYIADYGSNERQAIVFPRSSQNHLVQLLKEHGASERIVTLKSVTPR